jgi:octopine/nopaline transport system ATP-binding protein
MHKVGNGAQRQERLAVSVRRLRKSFGSIEVLKSVSLDAHEGDVISILGASGSGKSTLLRCINMLEIPSSGFISIGGEEIQIEHGQRDAMVRNQKQINRIRFKAAMVFQSFNLWSHMTVLENIIEAPIHVHKRNRKDCIEEAAVLLERVGLAHKRNEYPVNLSGGQQQRVAIARALAVHPEVILFDEPTSSLDPELVGEVISVMRSLAAEGRTMLVVTHEMTFARDVSSKVIFLHQGAIEEEGCPSEVFSSPRSERFRTFFSAHH